MASLTPRFNDMAIKGVATETKVNDDDDAVMNENEVGDLLNEAASSIPNFGKAKTAAADSLPKLPVESPRVTTTSNSTPTGQLSSKKIVPHLDISDNPSEVFVSKFSPDGTMLAAGCGDGAIRVFDANTGKLNYNLNIAANALPTTALAWRPTTEASRTRNVLIAANADGAVQHWHVTSGRCLHEINDPENSLFTVNYSSDGKKFATAGKDYAIRIYDEATKTLVSTMEGGYHAEQVTINIGLNQAVPRCKEDGHAWGTVISDNSVTWLALWHENVMNGTKYVWLSASSGFKGKSDRDKYEKAR